MSDLRNAARQGNIEEVVKLLTSLDVNSVDSYGLTPLHEAARDGHLEVAQLLIRNGANLHAMTSDGQTPLHYAMSIDGPTPLLHYSLDNRRGDVAMFLLESGADIHLTDYCGNTALIKACEASMQCSIVEEILKRGADITVRNDDGWTPLMMAVRESCMAGIIDILVEYGADVNLKDHEKYRVLYIACDCHDMYVGNGAILALLDYGFGNVLSDADGEMPDVIFRLGYYDDNPPFVECFLRHSIKIEVARLKTLDREISPDAPQPLFKWNDDYMKEFQNDCKLELDKMKIEKVKGTSVSYSSVFYLSPPAYRTLVASNVSLNWADEDLRKCMILFPIYGRLLYHRSKLGMRRVPLLEKGYGFFALLPELPELPILCVEKILSYLDETDLSNVAEICG